MHPPLRHNSTDSDTIPARLSPAQAQVVAALAQGHTITAAAREAGLHRSTIYHWLQHEPQFKAALEEAQREYVETLNDGMRELAAAALKTLQDLLAEPSTPPAVRLRAALAILQRPHFPEQGWHLPEQTESPRRQEILANLAEIKADYTAIRMAGAMHPGASRKEPANPAAIARNSPCPCGSGSKYKRCCGGASPGKFTPPAVAA